MSAPQVQELRSQQLIWGVFGLVLAGVIGYGAWSSLSAPSDSALPATLQIYGEVPEFSLIERSRQRITHTDLLGSIWIADFIFTHCPGMCPMLSQRMSHLQTTLHNEPVRFLSFSVDPERDTPQVLRRYAQRYHADALRWLFLTGERSQMYSLIQHGFQLSVEALDPNDPRLTTSEPIVHSNRFVLLDPQLRIRGYYRGDDTASMGQLLLDIETLKQE